MPLPLRRIPAPGVHLVPHVEVVLLQRQAPPLQFQDGQAVRAGEAAVRLYVRARVRDAHRAVAEHLVGRAPQLALQQHRVARGVGHGDLDAVRAPLAQLLGTHLLQEPAVRQEGVNGGHLLQLRQMVARHHHGDALLTVEAQEQGAHLHDAAGVEAARRLVQDEHLGLADERHRQAQTLLHAHGQVLARAVPRVGKAHLLEHPAGRVLAGHALLDAAALQVPLHAQVRVEARLLDYAADARPLALELSGRVLAEEPDLAHRGERQAAEELEQGGLPRAVVAHQAEHLPAPHGHAHVVERGEAAVALGEPPCLYHVVHRVASPFPRVLRPWGEPYDAGA